MSSGKRKPQGSVSKYGGSTTKKVKADVTSSLKFVFSKYLLQGPDIPSSNFAAVKSKPQTTRFPSRVNPEAIKSLPQSALNLQNPNAILKQLSLVIFLDFT